MTPLKKIYDMAITLKKTISISNYNRDICIINLGSEISAFKNGVAIDNVSTNFREENCFLKNLSKNILAHVLKEKIDVYEFKLNENVKPEHIILGCIDSIELKKPENSKFFSMIELDEGRIGIFYQSLTKKKG
jgi:hypothetical protein